MTERGAEPESFGTRRARYSLELIPRVAPEENPPGEENG